MPQNTGDDRLGDRHPGLFVVQVSAGRYMGPASSAEHWMAAGNPRQRRYRGGWYCTLRNGCDLGRRGRSPCTGFQKQGGRPRGPRLAPRWWEVPKNDRDGLNPLAVNLVTTL